MANRVRMAFEPEGRVIPLDHLLPLRTVHKTTKKSKKYQRIEASIRQVGVIEPIVVFPQNGATGRNGRYLIVDGHLRYNVLEDNGDEEVFCLIATDDETFTYNHKVNQIAPIQEHFMIMKALESGVPEQRIADTLNVDISSIRKKRDMLDGLCPEVVELLKDRTIVAGALREYRRVLPMRQIEMAELMRAAHNFSTSYAKCLVAATPQEGLVDSEQPKEIDGLRADDIARIEREMQTIEKDFKLIEDFHGKNVLNLVLVVSFIRRLIENVAVVKFLSRQYPDIFTEFEKLVEATDLGTR